MKVRAAISLVSSLVTHVVPFLVMTTFITATAQALEGHMNSLATIGSGVLFEKNNDNSSDATRFPLALGFGVRYLSWSARFEYQSFKTTDGNSTISIQREHEAALLWGGFEFPRFEGWMPYLAIGAGAGRTAVETRLSSARETAKGSWDGMFAGAGGLRAVWTEHLAVRPEIRYESADGFKTKDARMGAFIQVDYIF